MSTTVEKISSNKVKLSFDIDAAKFDEAMGKAYIKVRGQVAIPGFRKGHAPRKMIENMYGEGVFYDEAFELIFDEVYGPAIDENKLEVVDRPQVDIQQIGTGKNLQFTCEVFVKPDVTLGEYKGVEVNLSPGSVQKIQNAFHLASNIQILYHLFQFFQSLIDFSRKRYADKAQKHPKAGVGHTNLTAYVHRHFAVIPDVLF